MTDGTLHCCVMVDKSEDAGVGAELLSGLEFQASSWLDAETKELKHTLYFPCPEEAQDALKMLNESAEEWRSFGIDLSGFRLESLKREDWAESWKAHFKALEISDRLAVRPSWIRLVPKPGQAVVELDPGMSFGTGQHATTRFCLEEIDRIAMGMPQGGRISLLDAGCGSGILSIAAFKLGFSPVSAFDIDPDAVRIAIENAGINGISGESLKLETASLASFSGEPFDVVAANILSSALIEGSRKLLSLVKPGGDLILAGILSKEYDAVRMEFESLGCAETASRLEAEWQGGSFKTPQK